MPIKTLLPITDNYLSVRQPYAWAIIQGIKDIENRQWSTNVRGRIYIHAGKAKDELAWGYENLRRKRVKVIPDEEDLVFGAIIGSVEIVDCVERHRSRWYASGCFGFVLANPIAISKPIPMQANAKMQRVPAGILKRLKHLR